MEHCPDGSDEVECGIVHLPEGYMKSAPPPPLISNQELPTAHRGLPIIVEVTVASFAEINLTKMKMTVDFLLMLKWYDRRLQYQHLKSRSNAMNTLSLEDLGSMWIPEISFANTDGNQMTRVNDSTEAYVVVNGSYHLNSASENR